LRCRLTERMATRSVSVKTTRLIIQTITLAAVLSLTACAGVWADANQYRKSSELLQKREFDALVKETEQKQNKLYKHKDRAIKYLDLGMLYHYNGDYAKSNQYLEQAELTIDDLFTKSVSKAALSMLLNDNVLEYSGEDYEDIYTNAFKALNYLHLNNFDAAFVEIRRINMKLDLLEDKYAKMSENLNASENRKAEFKAGSNKFYSSALGRYLSMIIYRQEGKIDDAYIDYVKLLEAFETQPEIYPFDPPPLVNPHEQTGQTLLHVVSHVGRAPRKQSKEINLATSRDRITFVGIDEDIFPLSIYWPGIDPNLYFKFVMPYLVNEDSEIGRVEVVVDSLVYDLALLENIGSVAEQTFKVKQPLLLLKNATRTIAKGLAGQMVKQQMKKNNKDLTGDLLSLGTDIALYFSEKADLRSSRYFPNAVLVADIPLAPGEYNITVNYYDRFGYLILSDVKGLVSVSGRKLNLIESWQLQ